MSESLRPRTEEELKEAVAWAVDGSRRLEVVSGGSKRALGRPVEADATLDISGLSGIVTYEPEELVLTAKAGTPLKDIRAALDEKHQMLAFEPPMWTELLAADGAVPSLGGVLACNLAGPRRIKSGAARDHFLGVTCVSGRGEVFKAGGRVVKNVTGYDVCKLMCGSYGTLGTMAEVTVKVLPAAEDEATVLLPGLDGAEAVEALSRALGTPYEVSGAACLPAAAARRSAVDPVRNAGTSVTALRLEGTGPSVDYRAGALRTELEAFAGGTLVDIDVSQALWREIAEVAGLLPLEGRVLWRISTPPTAGPRIVASIVERCAADHFLDWGGGLVWLSLEATEDAGAGLVREAVDREGGHATLLRAEEAVRRRVPVFHPPGDGLARLTERMKLGFDPGRLLNRGRMYEDL